MTRAALANNVPAGIESLLDKQAVARRYGVSVRTVDRWLKERRIPCIRFGRRCVRFRWEAVERAVERLVVREVK